MLFRPRKLPKKQIFDIFGTFQFFWGQNCGGLGGRLTVFALSIPKLLIEEKITTLKTKIIVKTGKNTNFSIFLKRGNFLIY